MRQDGVHKEPERGDAVEGRRRREAEVALDGGARGAGPPRRRESGFTLAVSVR